MSYDLEQKLNNHMTNDVITFSEIKENQRKYSELLKINGDQISHFNKNIIELKTMISEHIKRVEPVIKAYEEEKIAKAYNDLQIKKVVKWSGLIAALTIFGGAILYVLRKFL